MIWPTDKLTRFEVARLLGARALQISHGAPILVKTDLGSPLEITKTEFKEKIVPITVKRKLPNNEFSVVQIKKALENWIADHAGEI